MGFGAHGESTVRSCGVIGGKAADSVCCSDRTDSCRWTRPARASSCPPNCSCARAACGPATALSVVVVLAAAGPAAGSSGAWIDAAPAAAPAVAAPLLIGLHTQLPRWLTWGKQARGPTW